MDGVSIDDIGLGTDPYIPTTTGSQEYQSLGGTSMAAPHVTGLLGLMQASDPGLPWYELRNLLISSGTSVPDFRERTVSGKRIRAADSDGTGALTCSGQTLMAPLKPMKETTAVPENELLQISVLNINCGKPAGDISATIAETSDVIPLLDDGLGFDQVAGDGIYSAQIDVSQYGVDQLNLELPGDSVVQVNILRKYLSAISVDYTWRDVADLGNQLLKGADDDSVVVISPFTIKFANDVTGYQEVGITSNGFISLLRENAYAFVIPYPFNSALPTEEFSNIIAPYWDDLVVSDTSAVYWAVLGEAPERELVVQWQDVGAYGSEGNITFQVVLFENSADILFNYQDVVFGDANVDNDYGNSATVGVQISSGEAQQYSFDTASLADMTSLLWMVENTPPVLTLPDDITIIEGESVDFIVQVSDGNAFSPVLSVENLPPNASFDTTTGVFIWEDVTPGVYEVSFAASDALDPALVDSKSLIITVDENIAPELDVQDVTVTVGSAVSFTVNAIDGNGTPVYLSASGLPPGASFDSETGLFEWTASSDTGTYSILFVAIDSVAFELVDVQVVEINITTQPDISPIGDYNVNVGDDLVFELILDEINPVRPILSVDGLPDGSVFNSATGEFQWESITEAGQYTITFKAENPVDATLFDEEVTVITVVALVGEEKPSNTKRDDGGGGLSWLLLLALYRFIVVLRLKQTE